MKSWSLNAPFDAKAKSILKTHNRYRYIMWGDDQVAVAYDYWFKNRNTKTYLFNPSQAEMKAKVISDQE